MSTLETALAHSPLVAPGRQSVLVASAALLLVGSLLLAVLAGPTPIGIDTVLAVILAHLVPFGPAGAVSTQDAIVWEIRLPRALVAALVGAVLAGCGACYQAVFRNPLADPYLIGVASGAGLGAALAIALPIGLTAFDLGVVTPAAFLGALVAVTLAYRLAGGGAISNPTSLVLAGVAVSYIASAGMSLIFLVDGQRFLTIFGWLLGGFNTAGWRQLAVVALYGLPALALILLHARVLNLLQLDDEQAAQLGVDVSGVRRRLVAIASLGTAAAVSVSGLIGFVGLLVPHLARLAVGPDVRRILPVSVMGGAAFLLLADVVARLAIPPSEVPIGIVTALVGGPFFLFMLRRRRSTLG